MIRSFALRNSFSISSVLRRTFVDREEGNGRCQRCRRRRQPSETENAFDRKLSSGSWASAARAPFSKRSIFRPTSSVSSQLPMDVAHLAVTGLLGFFLLFYRFFRSGRPWLIAARRWAAWRPVEAEWCSRAARIDPVQLEVPRCSARLHPLPVGYRK